MNDAEIDGWWYARFCSGAMLHGYVIVGMLLYPGRWNHLTAYLVAADFIFYVMQDLMSRTIARLYARIDVIQRDVIARLLVQLAATRNGDNRGTHC